MSEYPKYQASRMFGANRAKQIVVRCEDKEEFETLWNWLCALEEKEEEKEKVQEESREWIGENPPCPKCGGKTKLVKGTSKKPPFKPWSAYVCEVDNNFDFIK